MVYYFPVLLVGALSAVTAQTCDTSDSQNQALFESISKWTRGRMKAFDNEDLDGYFEGVAQDVRVEIFGHGKSVLSGISNLSKYKEVFGGILQTSFLDRQVWGFHTIQEMFYRIENNVVHVHMDYNMEECAKAEDHDNREACNKVWRSSGYYRLKMRQKESVTAFSTDVQDWELFDYKVHVMLTGSNAYVDKR